MNYEFSPHPAERDHYPEGSFDLTELHEPLDVYDPALVEVMQPNDQEVLLGSLHDALGSAGLDEDGRRMQGLLQDNLRTIASIGQSPDNVTTQYLAITPGFDLRDLKLPETPLSQKERALLVDAARPTSEEVHDRSQDNVMASGLLAATGSQLVRAYNGSDGVTVQLYKGMYQHRPTYFTETVVPLAPIGPGDEDDVVWQRAFACLSEAAARQKLDEMAFVGNSGFFAAE